MVSISSRLGNFDTSPHIAGGLTKTSTGRVSQAGYASTYPKMDLSQPEQFAQSVRNVAAVHDMAPQEARESGRTWYPRVHDMAEKGAGGDAQKGAALVAALSPAADFSARNIPAFDELKHLKGKDWKTIAASQETGSRTPEVASLLKGTNLGNSSDVQLIRAHRIMGGEDPEEVLNRRTAPKTNSFYHNILEPETAGHVTVDYRAHDIANNRMYPAAFSGRGISSALSKSGRPTRYEQIENVYRSAAESRDVPLPHTLQAITWETGKHIETSAPTKSGAPRKKGVTRKGQPYVEG